jgi:exopolysaccharide biosynthesis polyprenyl glycosylphosphotransferase
VTICLSINRTPVLSAGVFTGLVAAREQGVRIASMPQMYEDLMQKVAVEHVGNNLGVMFPVEQPRHLLLHDVFVRILDIAAGVVGLALTGLLMPFIALANACGGSPGPIFYRQLRVGKSGRNFSIVKFRSMTVNAEANGAQWSAQGDPRITPVGRFLRRTRLDELPQFWNILIGEMSLIGPRPERPEFVAKLAESIPFYRARHAVKPGLTGWAQVKYRYGSSEEDSLIKLQYDLYYIKHRSPVLDLRIISKTIRVVLTAAGQ